LTETIKDLCDELLPKYIIPSLFSYKNIISATEILIERADTTKKLTTEISKEQKETMTPEKIYSEEKRLAKLHKRSKSEIEAKLKKACGGHTPILTDFEYIKTLELATEVREELIAESEETQDGEGGIEANYGGFIRFLMQLRPEPSASESKKSPEDLADILILRKRQDIAQEQQAAQAAKKLSETARIA
jgi:hypothetical protein